MRGKYHKYSFCILFLTIILFPYSCMKSDLLEDKQDQEEIMKFDITGKWKYSDCSNCYQNEYEITEGDLLFDSTTYIFHLLYSYQNIPDSIIENGKYVYSSQYFVSFYGKSWMYSGEIIFHPDSGSSLSVQYRTGYPPNELNEMIFTNYRMKNDSSQVTLFWERE